ncbi:hypothetical protein D3C75_1213970 [compost metagenome]
MGQGYDARVAERLAQHHIVILRQAADGHQQPMLGASGQYYLLPASIRQPALYPGRTGLFVGGVTTLCHIVEYLPQVR